MARYPSWRETYVRIAWASAQSAWCCCHRCHAISLPSLWRFGLSQENVMLSSRNRQSRRSRAGVTKGHSVGGRFAPR
jgi:hypothetical protein